MHVVLALFAFPLIVAVILFASCFWIWMLIDCAVKDPDPGRSKVIWLLFILFTHTFGAVLYFLIRRPRRFAQSYPIAYSNRAI